MVMVKISMLKDILLFRVGIIIFSSRRHGFVCDSGISWPHGCKFQTFFILNINEHDIVLLL